MHKTAQKSASDYVLDRCYNNVHLEFSSDATFTTPIIFIELYSPVHRSVEFTCLTEGYYQMSVRNHGEATRP